MDSNVFRIVPEGIPNTGIMFADHSRNRRSGHLSHALVEYAPGRVMAFYSNCSGNRNRHSPGHNGFGWLEYRRSADGGLSWDEPKVFPYSMESFLNEPFTVSCEKAVSPRENEILAFCIRNENPNGWEPYLEPVTVRSTDGGETWGAARPFCGLRGRIYDAVIHDGSIYALMLACPGFPAGPGDRYILYRSEDSGETFEPLSELPGEHGGHAYGSLIVRPDGSMLCYEYDTKDEYNLICHVSPDTGRTWTGTERCFCAKKIRNPQAALVRGTYVLHGRSGCSPDTPMDFVLYTGSDGFRFDEGTVLCHVDGQTAYYSNNLVIDSGDGHPRVLIQASVPYDGGRVNVCHWFLEF